MSYRVNVESTSSVERRIEVEIPREDYDKQFDRILRSTTGRVHIKGFRPGRAPKAVVVKMYGEKIHGDVVDELLRGAFRDAVGQHDLKVVGRPQFEEVPTEDKQGDLRFHAQVAILPEPTVKDYFGLSFDVEVESVDEGAVEEALERLRGEWAGDKPITDRDVSQNGDVLILDYSGTVEGKEFPGSEGKDVQIELGSTELLGGLEAGLTGMKVGEEKTIEVQFPEDFHNKDLAGKTGQYVVTLKELREKELPEVNDDFAKKTKMAETCEELREKIRTSLTQEVEKRNASAKETRYFETLAEKNPFEIPQVLIDEEIRQILFEMRALDSKKRESFEIPMDRFRETIGKGAEFRVRRSLLITRVMKQENFSVSDAEFDTWVDEMAKRENATREQAEKWLGLPSAAERVREHVAYEKMLEKLLAKSDIKEVPKAPQEKEGKEEKKAKKAKKK